MAWEPGAVSGMVSGISRTGSSTGWIERVEGGADRGPAFEVLPEMRVVDRVQRDVRDNVERGIELARALERGLLESLEVGSRITIL